MQSRVASGRQKPLSQPRCGKPAQVEESIKDTLLGWTRHPDKIVYSTGCPGSEHYLYLALDRGEDLQGPAMESSLGY